MIKKLDCVICSKYRKIEKPKMSFLIKKKKKIVPSIFCSKYKNEEQKIFREEESIEILKILDLINNIEKYQKI